MKTIQVSFKYKLWYMLGLLAVYFTYLFACYVVTRNVTETLYNVPVWGIPCLFTYYILIHRMKIVVTDGGELVYKPSNSLFCETIDIQKIDSASLERGLLLTRAVIRYNGKERAFLYPQDVPAFLELLQSFREGSCDTKSLQK